MTAEQRTIRTTAEQESRAGRSDNLWRVRVAKLWNQAAACKIVLRPYYEEGWIAVVRAADWPGCPQHRELERLKRLLNDDLEDAATRDVRRRLATGVFEGKFSSGKVTIPREIVWLIAESNPTRDVTVVNAGPYLEVWSTASWRAKMTPSGSQCDQHARPVITRRPYERDPGG